MKIILTGTHRFSSKFVDKEAIGEVHLIGPIDTTACGLADEEYTQKPTNKKITCSTCLLHLDWAKKVAKIKE